MPDFERHESEDLEDYQVLDGTDTLDENPGDDPLDRGVATPSHWSAGLRYAVKGEEESESLDELLSEEEPDIAIDADAGHGMKTPPSRRSCAMKKTRLPISARVGW